MTNFSIWKCTKVFFFTTIRLDSFFSLLIRVMYWLWWVDFTSFFIFTYSMIIKCLFLIQKKILRSIQAQRAWFLLRYNVPAYNGKFWKTRMCNTPFQHLQYLKLTHFPSHRRDLAQVCSSQGLPRHCFNQITISLDMETYMQKTLLLIASSSCTDIVWCHWGKG